MRNRTNEIKCQKNQIPITDIYKKGKKERRKKKEKKRKNWATRLHISEHLPAKNIKKSERAEGKKNA